MKPADRTAHTWGYVEADDAGKGPNVSAHIGVDS